VAVYLPEIPFANRVKICGTPISSRRDNPPYSSMALTFLVARKAMLSVLNIHYGIDKLEGHICCKTATICLCFTRF